jgi:hypothetical protein
MSLYAAGNLFETFVALIGAALIVYIVAFFVLEKFPTGDDRIEKWVALMVVTGNVLYTLHFQFNYGALYVMNAVGQPRGEMFDALIVAKMCMNVLYVILVLVVNRHIQEADRLTIRRKDFWQRAAKITHHLFLLKLTVRIAVWWSIVDLALMGFVLGFMK